jgi:hypothetical protein
VPLATPLAVALGGIIMTLPASVIIVAELPWRTSFLLLAAAVLIMVAVCVGYQITREGMR